MKITVCSVGNDSKRTVKQDLATVSDCRLGAVKYTAKQPSLELSHLKWTIISGDCSHVMPIGIHCGEHQAQDFIA